jgi:hypothetical protein
VATLAKAYLYLCNGPVLQQARLYAPEAERSGREKQREKKRWKKGKGWAEVTAMDGC